jgi:hypothetical protein
MGKKERGNRKKWGRKNEGIERNGERNILIKP